MNSNNPKSLSTLALTFVLTLTLALTWFLSLRSVRLAIGDYYYNRGKFNQAVNWYEKVVRKEKLRITQDASDYLRYEQDLSKLKCALIHIMETPLLQISNIFGFGKDEDFKFLFSNPKLFLKDVGELIRDGHKEKLIEAEQKLANFNDTLKAFDNYKMLFEKDFSYLTSTSLFLKGILDEVENNFISADATYEKAASVCPQISEQLNERRRKILPHIADEYFYRSPLNWVKARELYETQIKREGYDDPDTFLRLAYIYAKFNYFSASLHFFKKAYELISDKHLKIAIEHFKSKGTFLYPEDINRIPNKLVIRYPFLKEITFSEARCLLNQLGLEVYVSSDGYIGRTGIKSPVDIIVRSAGYLVGNYAQIFVNGNNVSQNKRGYNIVTINPETGVVEKSLRYDTCGSEDDVKEMVNFIRDIKNGTIVCASVMDDASNALSVEEGNIFQEIGAKGNLHGKNRWGHGIIGIKGSKYGQAVEAISEKPVEIYVVNQKS